MCEDGTKQLHPGNYISSETEISRRHTIGANRTHFSPTAHIWITADESGITTHFPSSRGECSGDD